MARDFTAELAAAREAGDWAAHERIWEERRVGSVAADEAILAGIDGLSEQARDAVAKAPRNAPFEDFRHSVLSGEHDDHPEVLQARRNLELLAAAEWMEEFIEAVNEERVTQNQRDLYSSMMATARRAIAAAKTEA